MMIAKIIITLKKFKKTTKIIMIKMIAVIIIMTKMKALNNNYDFDTNKGLYIIAQYSTFQ